MFPELNLTRDTKVMSYGIIATKFHLGYTITKEAIETSRRLELCLFLRRKRDKTSTTKNPKRRVDRVFTIEEFER